ncbi:MAG: ABC transporter permease [SAR202 cluster bacterium]|nr:MAG: ABC transporter permease [SAR202 cluster bacterium]MCH2530621.1 ABC transporter permease [Dehalococcoidia bacterium]MQG90765.1 ABC transporter permease [SAR202 cluster bacterium]GIT18316.1 MAG: transport permease protein [Dehalococcoidia bacterium]|tara:strand:+ start:3881 stop:4990 length:1110 start_codon:yes stop_codon:yes gene_type:complete
MKIYLALTVVSMKMYFRNRQALFWALFFPLLVMLIFGMMNFNGYNAPSVGVHDEAKSEASRNLIKALQGDEEEVLKVSIGTPEEILHDLEFGESRAAIIIPKNYGVPGELAVLQVTYDERYTQERAVISTVLKQVTDGLFKEYAAVPDEYLVENSINVNESLIQGQGQGFKGWLIPGIAAMAIMQTGLFTVVFSLVRFKSQGVLRRLKATPIGAAHFLAGQLTTKAIVVVIQTYVLIIVGAVALGVSVNTGRLGAWFDLTILALLGGALFIAMGLAISGWAKSEETAAPMANVISMPMMFLSGVFFPLSVMPEWLTRWSQYLPLTYLADGMRAITVEGATVTTLGNELIGLTVWIIVVFAIATKTFRWE